MDVHGLIDGGHAGFTTPRVITALALLAIAASVVVQARVPHPVAA